MVRRCEDERHGDSVPHLNAAEAVFTDEPSLMCAYMHGGIELINGQRYVFYHRQTNRTNFSRQACAEKIAFDEDGRIAQVEVTSCGLNGGALRAEGMYPAATC